MKFPKFLLLAALFMALAPAASAAGAITYDGLARDLVFLPDSDLIPMALFRGTDELLPGQEIYDRVRLSGSLDADTEILMYMCVDSVESDAVLSGLTMDIRGMGGRTVFYGTLEKARPWIYLGSYGNGEGETLSLRLAAPEVCEDWTGLDFVGWRFLAVAHPAQQPSRSDTLPKTADAFPLYFWAAVLTFSAFALAFFPYKKVL